MPVIITLPIDRMENTGHGHVYKRPDGAVTACGGPSVCHECMKEYAEVLGLAKRLNCVLIMPGIKVEEPTAGPPEPQPKKQTTYRVNEIFYSVQGEGRHAGRAAVFVRFTGCNLRCAKEPGPKSPGGFDCDTEFTTGTNLTAEQIVNDCIEAMKAGHHRGDDQMLCVLTGGEPALQVDRRLVLMLQEQRFEVAIETNGTIDVSELHLDWITVSPKSADHTLRVKRCNEFKLVRAWGQALPPKPPVEATHWLVSPAFEGLQPDPRAMEWCVGLVKMRPEWRLSCQMHKLWGAR